MIDKDLGAYPTPSQIALKPRRGPSRVNGYAGWSFDPASAFGGTPLTAGLILSARIELYDSVSPLAPLTAIDFGVTGAGANLSANCAIGLSQKGKLLSLATGVQTAFQSTGKKSVPLATPVAPREGVVEVSFLALAGSGTPTMPSISASVADSGGAGFLVSDANYPRGHYDIDHNPATAIPQVQGTQFFAGQLLWVGVK